jgi:hypothetical protein
LVAGIAGQLLAMDSTLTPAEVKALLLSGAKDSVENSNGDNVAPSPVGNISDVVYEADAYGSLRRLSSRAGRPLCGAQVTAVRSQGAPAGQDHAQFSVLIRRYQSATDEMLSTDRDNQPMLYPGSLFGPSLSVAPGGRAFSVSSADVFENPSTHIFSLTPSGWVATAKRPGVFGIFYGERDTLVVDTLGVTFATASTAGRLAPIPFQIPFITGSFSFAPDGSAFAYTTVSQSGPEKFLWVVRKGGASQQLTLASGYDWLVGGNKTAFLPDSRGLLASVIRDQSVPPYSTFAGFESMVVRYQVGSGSTTEQTRKAVSSGGGTVAASLEPSDEGGRFMFRSAGPFYSTAEVDCAIKSARSGALDNVHLVRQLLPEPCGAVPPTGPGGGGGGVPTRIAQFPSAAASVRRLPGAATLRP